MVAMTPSSGARLTTLDGWRAISILGVLAAHMLPIGPKSLQLNWIAGLGGMSLFFTLSGFLITEGLVKHPDVINFAIRRLCRILPLAYLGTVVYMLVQRAAWPCYLGHFLFVINYKTQFATPLTGHFWSLCVEVHFYALIAILVLLRGVEGLRILPLLAIVVTILRVAAGQAYDTKTHLRVDEILAGATLALVYVGRYGRTGRVIGGLIRTVPLWAWLPLFAVTCHPITNTFMYIRPYVGAAVVGHTLLSSARSHDWLKSRALRYVAEISYALYVIHPLSMFGWLGSGERLIKYAKRPISFAITFGLAHLATYHYERYFTAWGKRLTHRWEARRRDLVWK
jgi:peptidoglycan/LPS O-acetylase OafA/YrhL